MGAGHDVRIRHVERDEEASDRGWRVAGLAEVQVENVPLRERRWGEGVK